jgi:hypothetical protein
MMAYDLDLATLDLAMASDCLSTEVVAYFCPIDLFTYLDEIRSTHTLLDGESVKLEKFSSMGNAFTFELESLIFWSVVSTVSEMMGRTIFGVYGDDLICHKQCVELIVETLRFIGFDINTSKSFTEGNFFESCGKHYYAGRDVTPLYQKTCPTSPEEGLRMANRIIRYAARLGQHRILDKRMRSAWECCVRVLRLNRYAGPLLLEGDGHLEVPFSSLRKVVCPNRGVPTLRRVIKKRVIPAIPEAMLAVKLRSISRDTDSSGFYDLPTERHFQGSGETRSDDVESRRSPSYVDRQGWVSLAFTSLNNLDW